jgi:ferredoxin-NADP reductase
VVQTRARQPAAAATVAPAGRLLLLVSATGTGPLRAVLAALPHGSVTIIYRHDCPADVGLRDDLHAAAQARGARAYYLPGTGQPDPGPLSPPGVRALIPVLRQHDACVCGPPELAAAAVVALRLAGVPGQRIAVAA